ncbi:hypothetical protein [Bradyrhizobium sp.]|uniref:hypothetical protein n=1 Tax=Bradyrhizobium sp. TaxID=376 RepID=UPI001DE3359E|nr:hypothetical protein [Bradyrhizobium sp.]MBI5321746.1 hypothetical protein [Bradyrhizobium sp.]
MSNRFSVASTDKQDAQLLGTLAQVAAIWIVSDAGYYFLLPLFGVQANYNAGSLAVTLYYGFWVGITVIIFWPAFCQLAPMRPLGHIRESPDEPCRLVACLRWLHFIRSVRASSPPFIRAGCAKSFRLAAHR